MLEDEEVAPLVMFMVPFVCVPLYEVFVVGSRLVGAPLSDFVVELPPI